MVVEVGLVTGYVIAWAVRKARRAAGRLDAEADAVIDAGLDQLHELVAARLNGHPVLAELEEEAAAADDGQVSELTRQQMELAITAATRRDEVFGRAVMELVARLREAEAAAGTALVAGTESAVLTGDAHAKADRGGIAFGQVVGDVHFGQDRRAGPPRPGRSGHLPHPAFLMAPSLVPFLRGPLPIPASLLGCHRRVSLRLTEHG